jgi:ABC-type multidrug transport system ATPase subunit
MMAGLTRGHSVVSWPSYFVAQDDVLHPHLTVRETLAFYAMLRLPRSAPAAAKAAVVEAVIGELGLTACIDHHGECVHAWGV